MTLRSRLERLEREIARRGPNEDPRRDLETPGDRAFDDMMLACFAARQEGASTCPQPQCLQCRPREHYDALSDAELRAAVSRRAEVERITRHIWGHGRDTDPRQRDALNDVCRTRGLTTTERPL